MTYGTADLAAQQITALVAATRKYSTDASSTGRAGDLRVRTFAKFAGLSLDGAASHDGAALSFFARSLHLLLTLRAGTASQFANEATCIVSLERALAATQALAKERALTAPAAEAVRSALADMSGGGGKGSLDADELLMLLLAKRAEAANEAANAPANAAAAAAAAATASTAAAERAGGDGGGGGASGEAALAAGELRARRSCNLLGMFIAADSGGKGELTLAQVQAVMDAQGRPPVDTSTLGRRLRELSNGREPFSAAAFVEACAPLGFSSSLRAYSGADERGEAAALDAEWVYKQPSLASQLTKLRAHVEATEASHQMSAGLLDRAVGLLNDLPALVRRGADEAVAATAKLHELEDALRRGCVAIELESAGGAV